MWWTVCGWSVLLRAYPTALVSAHRRAWLRRACCRASESFRLSARLPCQRHRLTREPGARELSEYMAEPIRVSITVAVRVRLTDELPATAFSLACSLVSRALLVDHRRRALRGGAAPGVLVCLVLSVAACRDGLKPMRAVRHGIGHRPLRHAAAVGLATGRH